jgi:ribosomal protein L40E
MAKKTLGYVELQWTCPNCGGINPGPVKTCTQCGAPQPNDVQFEQVKGGKLTQDEAVAARLKAGPDIHCPYCEARNPGDAKVCSQCGGDLVSGERRASGKVVGAYEKRAVEKRPCPHCGTENLETARTCSKCGGSMQVQMPNTQVPKSVAASPQPLATQAKKRLPVGLIIILVVICAIAAVFIIFATRTESVTGTVDGVGWERSIAIEGLVPVEYRNWRDQIPSDAEILACKPEVRSVESEMQPNAEEVCGTPYSVDTGSGYAEVVQDCEYYVYNDYCTYSVIEWAVVDTATFSGNDFYPEWPDPVLSVEQRLGEQTGTYVIYFNTGKEDYSYNISDYEDFQRFQIGTKWNLEVNALGGVVSVEP